MDMSYFLCLAVPSEVAPALRQSFDATIYLMDVSDAPIGKITRGKNLMWSAYLLQIGSSSASLFEKAPVVKNHQRKTRSKKGSKRKTHSNDHPTLLVSGIAKLMLQPACSSVSFLVHWMHGYISEETFSVNRVELVNLDDLAEAILNVEEDVQYHVVP